MSKVKNLSELSMNRALMPATKQQKNSAYKFYPDRISAGISDSIFDRLIADFGSEAHIIGIYYSMKAKLCYLLTDTTTSYLKPVYLLILVKLLRMNKIF